MIELVAVGLGGGVGALFRVLFSGWVKRFYKGDFPAATFVINAAGSFFLGLLMGAGSGQHWRLLLGTGMLGGFTTFSTFQYEAVQLLQSRRYVLFFVSYILSVTAGLLAAFAGLHL